MSGGKKTSTSNQTQTATTQLPAWMTNAGQDLFNRANAQATANPAQAYTGQIAPNASTNQQLASQAARDAVGTGQADLNAARNLTQTAATASAPTVSAPTQTATGYQATMQGSAPTVSADQVKVGEFDGSAADKYMNPYIDAVQQRTVENAQRTNAEERQALNDSVAGSKAFGGTRQALLEAEQATGQNRNLLDYLAQSNADAYTNAQQQFERDRAASLTAQQSNQAANLQAGTTNASLMDQLLGRNQAAANEAAQFGAAAENVASAGNADRGLDASKSNASNYQTMLDRMLAAGGQMSDIGARANDMSTQDIANLQSTGLADTALEGDRLRSQYEEFLRMQDAPMQQYERLMAILSGAPRNTTTTGTSTGTATEKSSGGLFNSLLGAGMVAGGLGFQPFSDRRLKRDIHLIETAPSGLGIYRYSYVWDEEGTPPHIGVMADEVERIAPHALGPVFEGFATVDYSKLGGLI